MWGVNYVCIYLYICFNWFFLRCWKLGSNTSVLKYVFNRCLNLGRKYYNNMNRKVEVGDSI